MDDRQLIEDLLSALEYHIEQTRPIQFSTVAIEAAREHLRKPAQQEPFTHYRHYDNGLQDWADEKTIPLYTTTPAQRKPLTHEQRVDLLAKFQAHKHEWHASAILIDMVEAAHGITGEKT